MITFKQSSAIYLYCHKSTRSYYIFAHCTSSFYLSFTNIVLVKTCILFIARVDIYSIKLHILTSPSNCIHYNRKKFIFRYFFIQQNIFRERKQKIHKSLNLLAYCQFHPIFFPPKYPTHFSCFK